MEQTLNETPEQTAVRERIERLKALPLGQLEQEVGRVRAKGPLTPQAAEFFGELTRQKINEWSEATKDLEAAQVRDDGRLGVDEGRYSSQFFNSVIKHRWAEKAKQEQDRSAWQATKDVVGDVVDGVVENPMAIPSAMAGGVRDVEAEAMKAVGVGGTDQQDQYKAGGKLASMIESGTRQSLGMLARAAANIIPGNTKLEQSVFSSSKRKALLEAGDVDGAWKTELDSSEGEYLASRGDSSFAKMIGLSRKDLEKEGITYGDADYEDVASGANIADLTEVIPFGLAYKLTANGVRAGMKATKTGNRILRSIEKIGSVSRGASLARKLETKADEVTRMAEDAAKYNTALKRARTAAGSATLEAGNWLRQQAGSAAAGTAPGILSAGVVLANGGDPTEAFVAGVAGTLVGKLTRSAAGRAVVGSTLQHTGRLMKRDLPLPLENFRRGVIDFRHQYSPISAVAKGAAAGTMSNLIFAIGAETDEQAAGTLTAGAVMGAGGAMTQRVTAVGRDLLVKGFLDQPEVSGPAAPSAPLGSNKTADEAHAAAEANLSQAGLRFSNYLRGLAGMFGAEFYVAQDAASLQQMANELSGGRVEVGDHQGVTIPAELSITGKPVAISRIGAEGGQSGGHEVTHAILAVAETSSEMKPLVDQARRVAADTLGATFDPKTGKLKYTSPDLDDIRAHYSELVGQDVSLEYALDEWIAEHGSVLLSGMPAGKLGGSSGVSRTVSKLFTKLADILIGRKVGLSDSGITTSEALPFSPSFDLFDALGNVIKAREMEGSPDVPDASVETVEGKPEKSTTVPEGVKKPTTFEGGPGVLTPIPVELATDQSLGTSTPPQQPTVEPTPEQKAPEPVVKPVEPAPSVEAKPKKKFIYTVQRGEGGKPGYVQIDDITDPQNRESGTLEGFREKGHELPDVPDSLPQGQYTLEQIEAASKKTIDEQPVNGALRGQDVQAARTNVPAPLTESESRILETVQPDDEKRPVAKQAWEHIKSVGGQRIGIPVVEASINQDGVLRSKRIAPYAVEISSTGKATVISVDIDRVNYNAGLLFDWAAANGKPERFGYTGINDPKFVSDFQTYLRNHAEGRRGSGEPLKAEGIAPATGEPVAKLTRDQELFFSTIMGQTPPAALTNRSVAAIARITATAKASGIEPRTTETGSVEPNALRDQLRKEGAPVDRIGEDPDPTRRQTNPKDRNSVVTRTRLQDFETFKTTGQSISQPNIRAVEASFMPARKEVFDSGPIGSGWLKKDGTFEWAASIASHDALAQKLGFKNIEDAQARGGLIRSWADRDDRVITVGVDEFSELTPKQQKRVEDLAIENRGAVRDDRGNVVLDYRDSPEARFMPPASMGDAKAQKDWLLNKASAAGYEKLEDAPLEQFTQWATEWRALQTNDAPPAVNVEQAKFQEFKKFFSNVTEGTFGKSEKPFVPEIPFEDPKLLGVIETKQKHSGNFDDHIMKSIPTFYEAQIGTISALAEALPKDAKVLDIAASEGSWGKALTELSGIKTISLDPNMEMARFFDEKSKVEGAEYSTEAFGASFEDEGRVVPQHDPVEKYDAIHEAMGFQFISPDREGQIAEVKRLLKPDGILVTEQKLKNANWAENEKFKDTNHKNKYFTTEELAAKDRVVGFSSDNSKALSQSKAETAAVGMVANQVEQAKLEDVLSQNFEYVTQYWDSGNFMGYVAGDNKAAVEAFVNALPDLNSKFSRAETPRVVQDGKIDTNAETMEAQSLKASEAAENARFMPSLLPVRAESALPEELGVRNVWIDPSGKVYPVTGMHRDWAAAVVKGAESRREAEGFLKRSGWVRGSVDRETRRTVYIDGRMNTRQKSAAALWRANNPNTEFVFTGARDALFMPAASLANTRVKGPDVQFKRAKPLKGAVGGVLDVVHFSSQALTTIDPKQSFGKGAATKIDMMGAPKAFFYKKGTAYEAPIASRSNVYVAQVDGNSIYDYNADSLGVRDIVNREKRDEAIQKAGFKGFYVETPGFDAVAIFDPIKVTSALRQDVMTPRQMKALGLTREEPAAEVGDLARERIMRSPAYEKARERIAKRVGSSTNVAFFDAVDQWVDGQVGKELSKVRLMPASKDGLGMYSQLQRTLEAIPEKASRAQIVAALRDGVKHQGKLVERPVKAEELADLKDQNGVSFSEYLKSNPDATRQDLIDFARAADVKVDERESVPSDLEERANQLEEGEELEVGNGMVVTAVIDEDGEISGALFDPAKGVTERGFSSPATALRAALKDAQSLETQYEDYQLPGGENYREVVLIMPPPDASVDMSGWTAKLVKTRKLPWQGADTVKDVWEVQDKEGNWRRNVPTDLAANAAEAVQQTRQWLDTQREVTERQVGRSNYVSSHFKDVPNYLAHARYNERSTPEGKVFFVEEIQSDLHQEGRRKGYRVDLPEIEKQKVQEQIQALRDREAEFDAKANQLKAKHIDGVTDPFDVLRKIEGDPDVRAAEGEVRLARIERLQLQQKLGDGPGRGTPNAPFKKSWPELVFKTLLHKAVAGGHDFIAWTTGEQQAARYDLSKQVDAVLVTKDSLGGYNVQVRTPGNRGYRGVASGLEASALEDHVGKELAQKAVTDLADKKQAEYTGLDLKVGGEGMKGFYDKILPSLVDKYAKKWGVKTEDLPLGSLQPERAAYRKERGLPPVEGDEPVVHALQITPEMRKDILENGQPRYMPGSEPTGDLSGVRVPRSGALSSVRVRRVNDDEQR